MGIETICAIGASPIVEKTTNWVVFELAILRRPGTLTLEMESANFFGTVVI